MLGFCLQLALLLYRRLVTPLAVTWKLCRKMSAERINLLFAPIVVNPLLIKQCKGKTYLCNRGPIATYSISVESAEALGEREREREREREKESEEKIREEGNNEKRDKGEEKREDKRRER